MSSVHQENVKTATQGLREYANAIRGSWGDIDGRSEKYALYALADAFETTDHLVSIDKIRDTLDVCPEGDGHWTTFCGEAWMTCGSQS